MRTNILLVLLLAAFTSGAQNYIFVGSFNVGDGPCWNQAPAPPTYTAQEAAALIFGGSPSDYAISVNSSTTNPATITHTAYVDGYGNTQYLNSPAAENFKSGTVYTYPSFSAYVKDHSDGSTFTGNCQYTIGTRRTNYVWRLCNLPTITCPPNQTANTSSYSCDAVVTYNASITGATSVSYSFSGATTGSGTGTGSSASFNKGSTTVTITATNDCGSVSCSFDVTVTDAQVPYLVSYVTPSSPVSISQLGRGTTYSSVQLNGGSNSIVVGPGANLTLSGNWSSYYDGGGGCPGCVTQAYIGLGSQTIFCHQANPGNSGSMYATFTAPSTPGVYYLTQASSWCYYCGQCVPSSYNNNPNDAIAVIIVSGTNSCPNDITVNAAPNSCSANVTYLTPVGIDNCPGATVTQTAGNPSGSAFNVGTTTNTFVVTDASNNTNTCSFTVTVNDTQPPAITCPANTTVDCQASSDPSNTGTATATDNCAVASVTYADQVTSGNCAGNYTITRTWTATDVHNLSSNCTQRITVQDNTPPVISCPPTAIVACDGDKSPATAGQATAQDNCSGATVTYSDGAPTAGNCAGNYSFVRTWTATDGCGNYSTCDQTINVVDNTPPNAVCNNVSVTIQGGSASVTPSQIGNGSTDNCSGISSMTLSKSTFTCSDIGNNTITLTVTDNCGNASTCQATVSVNGVVPSCSITSTPTTGTYTDGNNRHIYLGYGNGKTTLTVTASGSGPFTYSWSGASGLSCATPNCSSVVFTPTAGGNYTITAQVTNSYGCTTTCSIVICVLDIRAPGGNVYICHAPPGNPSNTQTLSVGYNAVAAHLSNHSGDRLGQCGQICEAGARLSGGNNYVVGEVVKVYPNPNTGIFTIELPYFEDQALIGITDVAGKTIQNRVIRDGDGNKISFDLNNVSKGMYFVEITYGDQRFRTKLIIQ